MGSEKIKRKKPRTRRGYDGNALLGWRVPALCLAGRCLSQYSVHTLPLLLMPVAARGAGRTRDALLSPLAIQIAYVMTEDYQDRDGDKLLFFHDAQE